MRRGEGPTTSRGTPSNARRTALPPTDGACRSNRGWALPTRGENSAASYDGACWSNRGWGPRHRRGEGRRPPNDKEKTRPEPGARHLFSTDGGSRHRRGEGHRPPNDKEKTRPEPGARHLFSTDGGSRHRRGE